jgi:hypothetical protein
MVQNMIHVCDEADFYLHYRPSLAEETRICQLIKEAVDRFTDLGRNSMCRTKLTPKGRLERTH